MSRYNSNYGSHDQLRESRELGMEAARERDALKKRVEELEDELYLAHEALRRQMP
tara:strand:- start:42 stop:206 length:165 start_codon:yes stop_codon:yes gene_type:complete